MSQCVITQTDLPTRLGYNINLRRVNCFARSNKIDERKTERFLRCICTWYTMSFDRNDIINSNGAFYSANSCTNWRRQSCRINISRFDKNKRGNPRLIDHSSQIKI